MFKIALAAAIAVLMVATPAVSMSIGQRLENFARAAKASGHPLMLNFNLTNLSFQTCSDPSQALELLRASITSMTDHLYTTSASEMQNAVQNLGYTREAPVGQIFPTQGAITVPLYRTFSTALTDHFYTTSLSERDNSVNVLGYGDEGIQGYVYPQQECGAVPLYRAYNPQIFEHFYTQDLAEKDRAVALLGYVDEGVAAYILPA